MQLDGAVGNEVRAPTAGSDDRPCDRRASSEAATRHEEVGGALADAERNSQRRNCRWAELAIDERVTRVVCFMDCGPEKPSIPYGNRYRAQPSTVLSTALL